MLGYKTTFVLHSYQYLLWESIDSEDRGSSSRSEINVADSKEMIVSRPMCVTLGAYFHYVLIKNIENKINCCCLVGPCLID